MAWLLAALAGVAFVEALLHAPFFPTLNRLRETIARVSWIIRSPRISDHWKERALPRHAGRIFIGTLKIALSLAIAFAPFVILALVAPALGVDLFSFAMSWMGMGFMTAVALAYAWLRSSRAAARV